MKHVAFDLDGVLIDALAIHRTTFIQAWNEVSSFKIDNDLHDRILASLSTKQKIKILRSDCLLTDEQAELVATRKQELTANEIDNAKATVPWLFELINGLKQDGRKIALVSNSIRATCERVLINIGVWNLFDVVVASDDITPHNKPNPTPYMTAADKLGIKPSDLLALEDSPAGLRAAKAAGCWVLVVSDPLVALDVTNIRACLNTLDDV